MDTSTLDPRWKDLYKLAGIAAIVSEFVILLGIVTFFIWPYTPGSKINVRMTPYSREAARKLYSDPKRRWLRDQVASALNERELFTQACAPA